MIREFIGFKNTLDTQIFKCYKDDISMGIKMYYEGI